MASLITQVPIPNTPLVDPRTGVPVKAWFDFFTTIWLRTGGPSSDASILLDGLGTTRGGMIARFATAWAEFEATVANTIPVMNPGGLTDVQLKTISQLLDLLGAVQGNVLFRGAAGWQVVAPSVNKFLMSNGAGADPSFATVPVVPASVSTGLAATGTVQADALPLISNWNAVATTAAGTGVVLPNFGLGTLPIYVWNDGANALLVYPPVGSSINALAANTAYSLPAARAQIIEQLTATLYRTVTLG